MILPNKITDVFGNFVEEVVQFAKGLGNLSMACQKSTTGEMNYLHNIMEEEKEQKRRKSLRAEVDTTMKGKLG